MSSIAATLAVSRWSERLLTLELILLHAFVLLLPFAEPPKNVALGLYMLTRAARMVLDRRNGRSGSAIGIEQWGRFDLALLLLLSSGVVSVLFSPLPADTYGGLRDLLRIVVLAWCVRHAGYDAPAGHRLLASVVIGALLAVPWGMQRYLGGASLFFELPSVGHANQSAIYLALTAGVALALTLDAWRSDARRAAGWSLACVALMACTFITQSRAAIGGLVVACVVLAVLYRHKGPGGDSLPRMMLIGTAALVLALATSLSVTLVLPQAPTWADKFRWTAPGELDAARLEIWRVGLQAWLQQPWTGIGIGRFNEIDVDAACAALAAGGWPCDRSALPVLSHPHSLYVGMLVERGLIGVAALAYALWAWSTEWHAARYRVRPAVSAAALASLVLILVCGLFNTTLRVEHGGLAMLLWALVRGAPAIGEKPAR